MTLGPEKRRSIADWLKAEVTRARVAEHSLVLRRAHGALLAVLIAVMVVLIFAVGIFVGFHYPYKTLPRPPLPAGQVAPAANCPHTMGGCLPKPKTPKPAGDPAIQGPDLSNNDPIYSRVAWDAIAAHNRFSIFKVIEGTGYIDRTARPMVALARPRGLAVGGYDFLHVCLVSATGEAHLFAVYERSNGLLGRGALPPTGDAEYPSSPQCNARAWIQAWVDQVFRELRVHPMIYTGAWWWQPHLGAYWPAGALAWISGYGVRYPYMPSGRSRLDLWQFSDHGYNGYDSTDLSVWRDGAQAFTALTGAGRPAPSCGIFPTARFTLTVGEKASECNTTRTWDRARCRNPVRRPVCKSSRYHLLLLRDRVWFVAHHHVTRGHWAPQPTPRWGDAHLGARLQQISRRLDAT